MLERVWRKENPVPWVGMWVGAATMETSKEFPQKTKVELPYDPTIALPDVYMEKTTV